MLSRVIIRRAILWGVAIGLCVVGGTLIRMWYGYYQIHSRDEIIIRSSPEDEVIEWLKARPEGLDGPIDTKWTHAFRPSASPLLLASYWGRSEVVRFLLEEGRDVNQAATEGVGGSPAAMYEKTPLYWAAMGGHLRTVCVILEREPRELEMAALIAQWDEKLVIEREMERRALKKLVGEQKP